EVCAEGPEGTGLFQEAHIIAELNPSGENYDYTFHDSLAEAVDGINGEENPLIISTSNPIEEKYVRFINPTSDCFSIAKITLKTYVKPELDLAELEESTVCAGEEIQINLEGSPESVINYTINDEDGNPVSIDNTVEIDEDGNGVLIETAFEGGMQIEFTENYFLSEEGEEMCGRGLNNTFDIEV